MARAKKEKTKAPKSEKKSKKSDEKETKRKSKKAEKEKPAKRKSKKADEEKETKRKSKKEGKAEKETKRKSKKESKAEKEKPAKRKSKKSKEEVEEVSEKPSKRKGKKGNTEEVRDFFDPLGNLDDSLDTIEKAYALSGSNLNPNEARLSTGVLTTDLILGGGLVPGWYTNFGPEQSCKSTKASTFMAAALKSDVPVIAYWDFEGSSSAEYIQNIMRTNGIDMSIEHVFGVRDPKTSKWTVKPRVRFYSEGVAEKFFDYLAKLERILPDKICMSDEWYYVYEGTKENRKIVGDKYDANYYRKTGKFRVPAKDGALQALVIVDSYPAMLPEKQDVDDPGSSMAVQARMFSDQLKRVKGKMKAKRICVVGVNQLRKAPMVMFGSPDYEPGGESLKFYSDCRLKLQPRALSGVPYVKGKGYILEEPGINGGKDTYRFIHIRAIKNKLSVPNLEGWLRLWVTDHNGDARGFDPAWDILMYLTDTGQITGKMNQLKLKIKGKEHKKAMSWMQFKTLILGSKKQIREVCDDLGLKAFSLREFCKKQLAEGNGLEMYFEHKKIADVEDQDSSDGSDSDDNDGED